MWEFLNRKKEAPAPQPEVVVAGESAPKLEGAGEQPVEQVNEKYAAILSQQASASAPVAIDLDTDVERVSSVTDAASRVTQLVELAQVKGVAHAVAVARRMNDLYVLDTMHDELADKLYDALKAKGLIRGE